NSSAAALVALGRRRQYRSDRCLADARRRERHGGGQRDGLPTEQRCRQLREGGRKSEADGSGRDERRTTASAGSGRRTTVVGCSTRGSLCTRLYRGRLPSSRRSIENADVHRGRWGDGPDHHRCGKEEASGKGRAETSKGRTVGKKASSAAT